MEQVVFASDNEKGLPFRCGFRVVVIADTAPEGRKVEEFLPPQADRDGVASSRHVANGANRRTKGCVSRGRREAVEWAVALGWDRPRNRQDRKPPIAATGCNGGHGK